jgi:hypothetical protein
MVAGSNGLVFSKLPVAHRFWGRVMDRPRVADDFAAIRARMKELTRERERAARGGEEKPIDARRRPTAEEVWTKVIPRRTAR